MIRGFWQSRLAVWVSAAVALALAGMIWAHDLGRPAYIPAVAIVLEAAVCLFAGQIAGKLIAGSMNTKYLSILHVQLDPQAFLRCYQEVPERLKHGSREYILARAYLAEGYAAAGEFDRAIQTLCPDFAGDKGVSQPLKGLYYHNLASYALSKGDTAQGEAAMAGLEQVVTDSRQSRPGLAQNMEESLRLYRNQLACLTGQPVEEDWLEEQRKRAPYALRRLEILRILAQSAAAEGQPAKVRHWLEEMKGQAGKTFYQEWACRLEQTLPVE